MGATLNIRKVVTEEFKKEFRRLDGNQPFERILPILKKQFDLRGVQQRVNKEMAEKEGEAIYRYHRNNLRYLAKYYAQTLHNQLASAKKGIHQGLQDKKLLADAHKVFKANPQCKIYH